MDWSQLESQALPTLTDDPTSTPLFGSTGRLSSYYPSSNQQSQWIHAPTYNGPSFSQQQQHQTIATDTAASTSPTPLPRNNNMALEERIARHQQELVERVLQESSLEIHRRAKELIEGQLEREWERERDTWLRQLIGTRTLGGAAASTTSTSSSSPLQQQRFALLPSSPSLPREGSRLPRHFVKSRDVTDDLTPLVQAHLEIIRKRMQLVPTIQAFSKLSFSGSAALEAACSGYSVGWQWALRLVSEQQQQASFTSADQARATLIHLCGQFRQHMESQIRSLQIADEATSSNNRMIQLVTEYSRLTVRQSATTTSASPWPLVYYCLRCGDAVAAYEAFGSNSSNEQDSVQRVLSAMARAQGNNACVWEQQTASQQWKSLIAERHAIFDFYQNLVSVSSSFCAFQAGSYALLSGLAALPNSSMPGFGVIEDYLTGMLWKALCSDSVEADLVQLGGEIQGYGPNYFGGENEAVGWSFVWPLLLTQQYQSAFSHLASSSSTILGLLQAAHLGLVFSGAGIPLCDGPAQSQDPANLDLAGDLLASYADSLLTVPGAGPAGALEYLVRIRPNRSNMFRACKEVASLIAETGDTDVLVGTINEEGVRQNQGKLLDEFFTQEEIESILVDAACKLLNSGTYDYEKTGVASRCYLLAGRYADVLELLNQHLSPPHESDQQDRQQWIGVAQNFGNTFLEKRTHIVDVLENQGQLSLISTMGALLGLNNFYVHVKDASGDKWERLNLLPTSQADLEVKQSTWRELDPLIKAALPAFIVRVMELLHEEHRRLKRQQGDSSNMSVVKDRLREIQTKAGLFVTYATLVNMKPDMVQRLSSMAALMI